MRNSKSPFNRLRDPSSSSPGSVGLRTPEHYQSYPKSPSVAYMNSPIAINNQGSNSNNKTKSTKKTNPLKFVAGAFAACFTPPHEGEMKSSTSFDDSELYKPPSSEGSERTRRTSRSIYSSSNTSSHGKEVGNVEFTIADIFKATRNFSPSLKIGQGGFGTVYKAQLRDGTFVAIKRAKKIMHDKHMGHEFQSEVETLAQVEHLNLVRLYGFLEQKDERILVVEYVPNGNLREHLDGERGSVLDFAARLDIAIDVAHAVTYLHTYTDHPIIHRDIKSSNILLTENLRAKVADFGFARLVGESEADATHVSTQVKGTAGYLDPEYLRTYQLTDKSDVYSFGILLVELVSGRRPIESKRDIKERVTYRWAIKKFTEGDADSTMDPRLERSTANNFALEKIFHLAMMCLAPHRNHRPPMQKCAEFLWGIRKDFREFAASDTASLPSSSQKGILLVEE